MAQTCPNSETIHFEQGTLSPKALDLTKAFDINRLRSTNYRKLNSNSSEVAGGGRLL